MKKIDLLTNEKGEKCFVLETNPLIHKPVFLLSMPKCGTYLMTEILINIGVVFTKTHISTFNLIDERNANPHTLKINPEQYGKKIQFNESLSYIKNGQFSIGHIPKNDDTNRLLQPFKKLLIYRQMHNMIISCIKYYHTLIKPRTNDMAKCKEFKNPLNPLNERKIELWFELWGTEFATICKNMLGWTKDENVFQISFEDLFNPQKNLTTISNIQSFFNLPIENQEAIISQSLQTDTPTKSKKLSNYKEVWTPKLEKLFIQHGFNQIDVELGYRKKNLF